MEGLLELQIERFSSYWMSLFVDLNLESIHARCVPCKANNFIRKPCKVLKLASSATLQGTL
ncbi:hypothetical protein SAMN03080615_03027 [Amphritea atlantica]|uniref:Uncharacterized protein n=1 Tax=Amphritea atlantica TaxID=355243 RepID=A0A1H9JHV0_9GAMM|nr:hypothetical protein SAMN03080615_03027 [Amphritea atlantica]